MEPALEHRAEKHYEWRQSHAKTLGSGAFSLAAVIVTPLLAAVFEPKADVAVWHVCLFGAAMAIAVAVGVWWHVKAAGYQREYWRRPLTAEAAEAASETPESETLTWSPTP